MATEQINIEETSNWLRTEGKLEDSYIVGVLIGRGAFSMVFKCLYKGKTERACKVYDKMNLDKNRIQEQINSLLKLEHPNLIQIHEVYETDKNVQLICDLVKGEELLERVEKCSYYSERHIAAIINLVLSVLQYLHDKGIAHGAVCPENLNYESENPKANLKLSDLSLYKSVKSSPTSYYSAPDFDSKLTLKEIQLASDVWNTGMVTYIMLCGFEPSPNELYKYLEDQDEDTWTDISPDARDLLIKMLQPIPSERITISKALDHPWIHGTNVRSTHLTTTHSRIKHFNARRKLKATAHAIIATQRAMTIIRPQR
uniref:Protein kinase domain-containing protein n=1 Tax=Clastoptera arizonana TaxID=38151 RepID=A0A1B6BYC1_9HEMI